MQIKKLPKVAVVATKLNFLQYTYRFRINHKTLYSQTYPGHHFGSWNNMVVHTALQHLRQNLDQSLCSQKTNLHMWAVEYLLLGFLIGKLTLL